ncbi:hypothetical protein C8J57DRAFT_1568993 [Mycena rebaudengoi]|nr:hypothetical protein C8J57DRAFT_1568993 [Mycena rebaudengoi]
MSSSLLDTSNPLQPLMHSDDDEWNHGMWPPQQKLDFWGMEFGLMEFQHSYGVDPFQFTFESSASSSSESSETSGPIPTATSAYSSQVSCGDLLEVSDPALELASRARKSAGVIQAVQLAHQRQQQPALLARKGSKATVLGKAVEYIRVLKNRECCLAREFSGLKTLLSLLAGAPTQRVGARVGEAFRGCRAR